MSAEADVIWHATPTVSAAHGVPLARRDGPVPAPPRRVAARRSTSSISASIRPGEDGATTQRFAEALADARLFPPAFARPSRHCDLSGPGRLAHFATKRQDKTRARLAKGVASRA